MSTLSPSGREVLLGAGLRVGHQSLRINDQLGGRSLVVIQTVEGLRESLDLSISDGTATAAATCRPPRGLCSVSSS